LQYFDVGFNAIVPVSGRGILLDGWGRIPTQQGVVHDNYVNVFERPNLEYGDQMEATAFRLRNWDSTQRDLVIDGNFFMAWTGPGGVHQALGARISQWNDKSQSTGADDLVAGNVFKAIVNTTDPYYTAQALTLSNIGAGTGLTIDGNLLTSNDGGLNLGDNDSWQGRVDDVTMADNTIRVSNDGPSRPFESIVVGSYETEVSSIRLPDTHADNGAPTTVVLAGGDVHCVNVGWE